MITISAPQGPRPKISQRSLWGRKRSFFLPHRDRPQDITTSIKSSISANPSFLESMPPSCEVVPRGAGNDHAFCPTGTTPQDITTRLKHCNLQCFLPYQEQNSAICDVFSSSSPKIEPKHWYLRCFRNNQKSKRSQNTAICDTLATQHVRNAVFYSVFGTPFQKHWFLQCFVKTHARNTVSTNEFKDYIFHGNKPQKAKTLIFTAFLHNDFSKNMVFLDHVWLLKPPKTKRGGYPPTPLPHLKF